MAGPSDLAGFMDAPETGLYKATEISFNMEGDAGLNCSSWGSSITPSQKWERKKERRPDFYIGFSQDWLKIYNTSYLVYSYIWLNLSLEG
jgi:hypothetical protein